MSAETPRFVVELTPTEQKGSKDEKDSVQLDEADLQFTRSQQIRRVVVGVMWVASLVTAIGSLVVGVQMRDLVIEQMPAVMGASFDFVALGLLRSEQIGVAFTTVFEPANLAVLSKRFEYGKELTAPTVAQGIEFWKDLNVGADEYAKRLKNNDLASNTSREFKRTYVPFLARQRTWEIEGMDLARDANGDETLLSEARKYMSLANEDKNNASYFDVEILSTSLSKVQLANADDLTNLKQKGSDTRERAVKWGIASVSVLSVALVMALLTSLAVRLSQEKLKLAIRRTRQHLRRRMALDEIKLVASPQTMNSHSSPLHPNAVLGHEDDEDFDKPSGDNKSSDAGDDRSDGDSVFSGSTLESRQTGSESQQVSGTGSTHSSDWRNRAQTTLKQKERIVTFSFLVCWLLLLASVILFWVQAERAEGDVQDIADVQVPLATKSYKVVSDLESAWSAVMLAVSTENAEIQELYSYMTSVSLVQFQDSWKQILELSNPPQSAIDSANVYMETLANISQLTASGADSASIEQARGLFNSTMQTSVTELVGFTVPLRDSIVADVDDVSEHAQSRTNTALVTAIIALTIGLLVAIFAIAAENKRVEAMQLHWNARTWSLERVIDQPELREMLLKHGEQLYCGENVDFLFAYSVAARNGLTGDYLAELYSRFLASKAPDMLNVSDALRSKVVELFESNDEVQTNCDAEEQAEKIKQAIILAEDPVLRKRRLRALARVQDEVSRLVTTNLLPTLLQSQEFSNWQKEHRAQVENELKLLQKRAGMGA